MCIECAYQTGRNLMNMVNDVKCLNTKCPGCEREMTREFYQIMMLLIDYIDFKTDFGKSMYSKLLDHVSVMKVDEQKKVFCSLMGKLNHALFSEFISLMMSIAKIMEYNTDFINCF
jgi:hypothetical protein